jgi:predicted amidohydrolase
LPYFEEGQEQMIVTVKDVKIAPAICYESLKPDHSAKASMLGADIYLASVAKSMAGVIKAMAHYPAVAAKYAMPVLMSNSIGDCDNFTGAGFSSVWTHQGNLAAQLSDKTEGILIFDTETERTESQEI